MRLSILIVAIFTFFCFQLSYAQQVKIDNFTLKNVINNKTISLSDYKDGCQLVVLIFTSNYCPYAKFYEDRIIQLAQEYQSKGVQILLINSNNSQASPEDSEEEMAKKAQEKHYTFPYLADKNQVVANMVKNTKNPEAFVLHNAGGKFLVKYQGALDDSPQDPSKAKNHYLKDALETILSKRNLTIAYRNPTGCLIKK